MPVIPDFTGSYRLNFLGGPFDLLTGSFRVYPVFFFSTRYFEALSVLPTNYSVLPACVGITCNRHISWTRDFLSGCTTNALYVHAPGRMPLTLMLSSCTARPPPLPRRDKEPKEPLLGPNRSTGHGKRMILQVGARTWKRKKNRVEKKKYRVNPKATG